jgi:hypothetical protein
MMTARRIALTGVAGAAVLAVGLLLPAMRLAADGPGRPWLGALVMIAPTAALLAATGYRHYGIRAAIAVGVAVTLVSSGVSWVVSVAVLVTALDGSGNGGWVPIFMFVTPAVSVLVLGALALRVVPGRSAG